MKTVKQSTYLRRWARVSFGFCPLFFALWVVLCVPSLLMSQNSGSGHEICPRPAAGSTVSEPPELHSENGVLEVTFHFKYQATRMGQGPPRYCYITDGGLEAPTLRVRPGDQLIIHFKNDLTRTGSPSTRYEMQTSSVTKQGSDNNDCDGGAMTAAVTNLHFHGLTIPPTCHQDDVIRTLIQPGQNFEYRVRIPQDEPPGLYWYHPHPHGFSERQVQGGASGALIVEGIGNVTSSLSGLPQRLIVLRDQPLTDLRFANATTPAWDISINYVPVTYPQYLPATIQTRPAEKELWRVLNAAANTIFNLQLMVDGVPQTVRVVAIDGVPVSAKGNSQPLRQSSIFLPPGARVEFVVTTPEEGAPAQLVTQKWNTGPAGDIDPGRPIANIVSRNDKIDATLKVPLIRCPHCSPAYRKPMNRSTPVVQRTLYFSQLSPNTVEADVSVFYYLTVLGQKPAVYDMNAPPNIIVHEGDVEDWIVENRAPEDHVFHIHQLHFRVLEINGKAVNDPAMRDTVDLPYWTGTGPYPSVKLRMDFRDPNIEGTFLYHCHILKHEDMGMMGSIQVLPPGIATSTRLTARSRTVDVATTLTVVARVRPNTGSTAEPTGTIQFTVDGISAGRPVPVVKGQATFTTSFEESGEQMITATYSGDTSHDESVARPLAIKVLSY